MTSKRSIGSSMAPSIEETSIVLQGPIIDRVTEDICASLRRNFGTAEIIVSTWRGENTTELEADCIIFNEDPGSFDPLGPSRNVNRQIVSTKNGLAKASRAYSLKLRSDCVLETDACLDWFEHASSLPRPESSRVFRDRIIIPRHFTRNPVCYPYYLYHPSDIFMFGRTEDLLLF